MKFFSIPLLIVVLMLDGVSGYSSTMRKSVENEDFPSVRGTRNQKRLIHAAKGDTKRQLKMMMMKRPNCNKGNDEFDDRFFKRDELRTMEILDAYYREPEKTMSKFSKEDLTNLLGPLLDHVNDELPDDRKFRVDDILRAWYRTPEQRMLDAMYRTHELAPIDRSQLGECVSSLISFIAKIFGIFLSLIGLGASASEKVAVKTAEKILSTSGDIANQFIEIIDDNDKSVADKILGCVKIIIDNAGVGIIIDIVRGELSIWDLLGAGLSLVANLTATVLTSGLALALKVANALVQLGGFVSVTIDLVKNCSSRRALEEVAAFAMQNKQLLMLPGPSL